MKRIAYLVLVTSFVVGFYICLANVLDRERLGGILLSRSALSIEGFGTLFAMLLRLYLILVAPVLAAVFVTLAYVERRLRKRANAQTLKQR
jgi:hypothetical protein